MTLATSCLSLEPTYEGLKPETGPNTRIVPASLEPTYEGLKRVTENSNSKCRVSLEPTYEGLKRITHRRPGTTFGWFGAYLRGIETHDVIVTSHVHLLAFGAYLRGIETHPCCWYYAQYHGLEPTYEGLKHAT